MFKIGDNVIKISSKNVWEDCRTHQQFEGPVYNEVLRVIDITIYNGLRFAEYSHCGGYDSTEFEKLVSNEELKEYKEQVSKIELQEVSWIESINCTNEFEIKGKILKLKDR